MRHLIFGLCLLLATACGESITPNGEITTQTHTFTTDITTLSVGDGIQLYCDNSLEDGTIEVIADRNLHQYVKIDVIKNTLTIKLKWGYRFEDATIKAKVSSSIFDYFSASGGSSIIANQELSSDDITIDASGDSYVKINGACNRLELTLSGDSEFLSDVMIANDIDATLSGGANATLNGTCTNLDVELSGGSKFDGKALIANSVVADLSGGSKLYIAVISSLEGNASGGSEIHYSGSPAELDIEMTGGSRVVKSDK